MKKICVIFLMIIISLASSFGFATGFYGIHPGKTTKSDVKSIIGVPKKEIGNNIYLYSISGKQGDVPVSIQYFKDKVDLLAVDYSRLDYKVKMNKKQAKDLFGLNKPDFSRKLSRGKRMEGYDSSRNVALVLDKKDAIINIIYLSSSQYALQKAVSLGVKLKKLKDFYLAKGDSRLAADFYYTQSKQLMEEYTWSFQEALMAYEICPDDKKYQDLVISMAEDSNQPRKAERLLRQSLGVYPYDIDYNRRLGMVLCKLNKLDEADECFRKVLKKNPDEVGTLAAMSWICKAQNRPKDALEYINKALKIKPNDAGYLNRKGCCLKLMNKNSEALDIFEQAVKENPKFSKPYYNMGEIYEKQKKYKEALEMFEKVVKLDPSPANTETLNNFKKRPRTVIKKVWLNHDVVEGMDKGLRINLQFEVNNLKNEELWVGVYFYDYKGKPVPCNDIHYIDSNGKTRAFKYIKPKLIDTSYNDFALFVPYRAFASSRGKHNYKCKVSLFRGTRSLAGKEILFDYEQSVDAPRASIEKIWLDYDVFQGNRKGSMIHVKFRVENLKGKKIGINAFFLNDKGRKIFSAIPEYVSPDGQATIQLDAIPRYKDATYKDYNLFFPYYAFYTPAGQYEYKCEIEIKYQGICLAKDEITFNFTRR